MSDDPSQRALANVAQAQAALEAGDGTGALRAGEAALELLTGLQGEDSADVAYVWVLCSRAHAALGDLPRAVDAAQRGWAIVEALADEQGGLGRLRVQARQRLGQARLAAGDYVGARAACEAALADAQRQLDGEDLDVALVLNDLGMIGKYDGDFGDAAERYERALQIAERHDATALVATLHHNLAGLAHSRGDFIAAEPHARRALQLNRELLGDADPRVAGDEGELAEILASQGKLDEALALARHVVAAFTSCYGPRHLEVGIARTTLGAILHRRGDLTGAAREYRAGLAIREALVGREHPELAPTLINLGGLLAGRGELPKAERLYRRALGVLDGQVTADHPRRVACVQGLAGVLEHSGRAAEARRLRAGAV